MHADHHHHHHHCCLWPPIIPQPWYSSHVDDSIERDLHSKRYLLPSDIYCRTSRYKPIRSHTISPKYPYVNAYRSMDFRPILPRPISPVELPRITFEPYQPRGFCKTSHRYDFSSLNSYNREPSYFPLAHNYFRLQTDYENFYTKKITSIKRINLKQRWKSYGFILIFYFMLKKNLRLAKQKDTYYQRDYHRIRFLELTTAIHRVYLEPNSSINKALSYVISSSTKVLNQENIFSSVRTILHQITNFLPKDGILGTQYDESVLIYLLNCTLEQYPPTYFWSIERHLLSISFAKMKGHQSNQLDHFTTKFLLISTFIFRGLTKTLLLKPVKYRLTRGKLNQNQWSNARLVSTLILSVARHAVIYKEAKTRLPMPFPFEMKNYLIDDDKLKGLLPNVNQLIESTAPKISAWACEYAERLQRHIRAMKSR